MEEIKKQIMLIFEPLRISICGRNKGVFQK